MVTHNISGGTTRFFTTILHGEYYCTSKLCFLEVMHAKEFHHVEIHKAWYSLLVIIM